MTFPLNHPIIRDHFVFGKSIYPRTYCREFKVMQNTIDKGTNKLVCEIKDAMTIDEGRERCVSTPSVTVTMKEKILAQILDAAAVNHLSCLRTYVH